MRPYLALLLVAACGSRTGLEATARHEAGVVGVDSAVPSPDATVQKVTIACSAGKRDWLIFTLSVGDGSIHAMRADGSDGHTLHLPQKSAGFIQVSPDGASLVYGAEFTPDGGYVDGGIDTALYLYDLTSHTSTLVLPTVDLTYSALSPDRSTIAYTSGFSLRAVAPDGTDDRLLLEGDVDNDVIYGHPTFAPDSRTILYGAFNVLGSVESDGTEQTTLVPSTTDSEYPNPAFSPDSSELAVGIACPSDPGDEYYLRIYDYAALPADCSSGARIAEVEYSYNFNSANDPTWSGSGLIAYASGKDVYIVDQNGGPTENVTKELTGDAGFAADPVWVPACATLP